MRFGGTIYATASIHQLHCSSMSKCKPNWNRQATAGDTRVPKVTVVLQVLILVNWAYTRFGWYSSDFNYQTYGSSSG